MAEDPVDDAPAVVANEKRRRCGPSAAARAAPRALRRAAVLFVALRRVAGPPPRSARRSPRPSLPRRRPSPGALPPPSLPPSLPPARRSHLQKNVIDPLNDFFRDATSFVAGCSRPDKDFVKIATAVAVGFAVVGGTGYIVKFVHIPITQILIG